MLKEILKAMLIVLILLGVATKLGTSRKIAVSGAVSGNANFDGSENINIATVQNNIAVIEGNLVCNKNTEDPLSGKVTYTSKEVDFPEGFNRSNCFVISLGGKSFIDNRGYGYGNSGVTSSLDIALGTEPLKVQLGTSQNPNKIRISVGNISTTELKTKYYQIVLMKK